MNQTNNTSKFDSYLEEIYTEGFFSSIFNRVRRDPSRWLKMLNNALSKISPDTLKELNKILRQDVSEVAKFEAVKKFIEENPEQFNLQRDASVSESFFEGDKFLKRMVSGVAALIVAMSILAGYGIHQNIKAGNEFVEYEKKGMTEAIRKERVVNVGENAPSPVNAYPGQTFQSGGMYYKVTPPSVSYYIVYKYGPRGNQQKEYKKPITKDEFNKSKLPISDEE